MLHLFWTVINNRAIQGSVTRNRTLKYGLWNDVALALEN